MWQFFSAAYLLHALASRKELTSDQQMAMQRVLASISGVEKPPAKLRDMDTALYVHARTLAAENGVAAQVALDGLQQRAPALYASLKRRSSRWGDAATTDKRQWLDGLLPEFMQQAHHLLERQPIC